MPKRVSSETVGLALMVAVEVPALLAMFLPSPFTMEKFAMDEIGRRRLKRDMVLGGTLAVGLGVGVTVLTSSLLPLLAALVVLAISLYEYRDALNSRAPKQDMRDGARPGGARPGGSFYPFGDRIGA